MANKGHTIMFWVGLFAALVTIIGGIAGGIIYFLKERNESIETTKRAIVKTWTNEGDASLKETHFITLKLEDIDGDIIGSLSTNTHNRILEVHAADIGWFTTTLEISELQGRVVVPIATVRTKLTENNNRLNWNVIENKVEGVLPKQTILWPTKSSIPRPQVELSQSHGDSVQPTQPSEETFLALPQVESSPSRSDTVQPAQLSDEALSTIALSDDYSPVSMKEYFDTLEDETRTELQRDEFKKRHLGKRVVWKGRVRSVKPHWGMDDRIVLSFQENAKSSYFALCYFPSAERDTLLGLSEGTLIKITGIIDEIDSFLEECRILERMK